jgi:flavin reductase (DIM6/NTAB) family NADH-FMN oxidoreductase RutF
MMEYTPNDLTHRERYKVLTGFVLLRPIAWVTTIGSTGVVNAAPFSFFNVFCEDPPLCIFAANLRPDGRVKDTVANIQRTGEFVVNIADEPLARAMHDSSGDFPPETGEPGYLGLKLAPSTKVAVPRLAPWAMECKPEPGSKGDSTWPQNPSHLMRPVTDSPPVNARRVFLRLF